MLTNYACAAKRVTITFFLDGNEYAVFVTRGDELSLSTIVSQYPTPLALEEITND